MYHDQMSPKIIAELCQNHNGDVGLIKEMVAAAKDSGAYYAKIQTINSSQLTHRKRFDEGLIEGGKVKTIKRGYSEELERLKGLDITNKEVEIFLESCRDNKIEPMTTIFTRDVVKKTFNQGFKCIKVASFDCNSYPMVEEIIDYKPNLLLVSTGCSYKYEIEKMSKLVKSIKEHGMMHCVSIYPTPIEEANINRISYLKKLVDKVGLSDHSNYEENGLEILKWAVCEGIEYVERHFTVIGKDQTKDGKVSLNPEQLKEATNICSWDSKQKEEFKKQNIDKYTTIMGDANRELSEAELLNRDYYQGRFASKSKNGDIIYNWDTSFKKEDIDY